MGICIMQVLMSSPYIGVMCFGEYRGAVPGAGALSVFKWDIGPSKAIRMQKDKVVSRKLGGCVCQGQPGQDMYC